MASTAEGLEGLRPSKKSYPPGWAVTPPSRAGNSMHLEGCKPSKPPRCEHCLSPAYLNDIVPGYGPVLNE
jgi:hypothetical protein